MPKDKQGRESKKPKKGAQKAVPTTLVRPPVRPQPTAQDE